MKEKKNIILLIFAVIFFIIAIIFFVWSFLGEHNTNFNIDEILGNHTNIGSNDIPKNENTEDGLNEEKTDENEDTNTVDKANNVEVSKTQDVENVEYKDITVYNENNEEVSLSKYAGKPVMLLFWSPENKESVEVLKKVNDEYNKYNAKITFLMVSTSKEIPEELKKEIAMDIYYDLNNEYQTKYNVETLPTMVYIAKENTVINAKSGVPSSDAIEANLDILVENF